MKNKNQTSGCGVVILAAGMGKRMRSPLPKVLHEIAGKPLLFHVLNRISEIIPNAPVALVLGHGREAIAAYVRQEEAFKNLSIDFIIQEEQKGTGHAARCAMLSDWGSEQLRRKNSILVLPGDTPLISAGLIEQMVTPLSSEGTAVRLLTCVLPDPTGYGRVVRKGSEKIKPVQKIVEQKDATEKQRQISEVAASIYLFRPEFLKRSLIKLSNQNAQGEYYLTDLIEAATKTRQKVDVLPWPIVSDLRGVNDPWELALAGRAMNERLIEAWSRRGVMFEDPWSNQIEATVQIGEGVKIGRGAILKGKTKIEPQSLVGPYVVLKDSILGLGSEVKVGTVAESSILEAGCKVGPYAHLRPESRVGEGAKIGNFVELKKTRIGNHTSVAHLSYLGDADVGKNVNIGCGFVTCNFDGRTIDGQRKHKTIIEDEVFVGSDCQAVAPIRIGKAAYIASGSTVTEDVEPGALVIARSRQVSKPGYARKLKSPKEE